MKQRQVTHAAILLCLLIASAASAQPPKPGILGEKAPAWDVTQWFNLPDGVTSLDIGDYKGKVVYLYAFQSWCPGCHRHGFPTLTELIEHYKGNDQVRFVAVQTTFEGFDTNTPDKAKSTAQRYKLTIPVGHSGSRQQRSPLMNNYRTGGTPWTVIINRDGVVRFNDFHIEPKRAIELIDDLLEQKAAADAPATQPAELGAWKSGKLDPAAAWAMLDKSIEARARTSMSPAKIAEILDDLAKFGELYTGTRPGNIALFNHGIIAMKIDRPDLAEPSFAAIVDRVEEPQIKLLIKMQLGKARVRAGAEIPRFDAKTLDDRPISTDAFKGKVVLLDFWATWCGPCIRELPHLRALQKAHGGDDFVLMSISLDDEQDVLREFIAENDMPWTHVFNNQFALGQDLATMYGAEAIPRVVLVGRDGRVVATDLRGHRLEEAVKLAMAQAVAPPTTQPAP